MNKPLINDFDSFNKVTYEDYVQEKGYNLLTLSNISHKYSFEKRFNKLIVKKIGNQDKEIIPLEEYTIIDLLNKLLEYDPTIEVHRYIENSVETLNVSALFLADFGTVKTVKYNVAYRPIDLRLVEVFTDRFNSTYQKGAIEVTTKSGLKQAYTVSGDNLFIDDSSVGSLYVTYKAVSLNLQVLKEFVLSDINQLYTYSEVTAI